MNEQLFYQRKKKYLLELLMKIKKSSFDSLRMDVIKFYKNKWSYLSWRECEALIYYFKYCKSNETNNETNQENIDAV